MCKLDFEWILLTPYQCIVQFIQLPLHCPMSEILGQINEYKETRLILLDRWVVCCK